LHAFGFYSKILFNPDYAIENLFQLLAAVNTTVSLLFLMLS